MTPIGVKLNGSGRVHLPRQAKVAYLEHKVLRHEHVARRHVAMHKLVAVEVREAWKGAVQ